MQLNEDHWERLYVFAKNLADNNIALDGSVGSINSF